jgi:putative FmdB family regulatory protein
VTRGVMRAAAGRVRRPFRRVVEFEHIGATGQPANLFGVERRIPMPLYEYFCEECRKEVSVRQTVGEHDKGAACPDCGGRTMQPLIGPFFSKTSRKS